MKKLLTVLCLILLLFPIMPIGAEETESAGNSNEKILNQKITIHQMKMKLSNYVAVDGTKNNVKQLV